MPISVTTHAPGLPASVYDEVLANHTEPLRQSAGFISHAAEITPQGLTVTEVWETREQWERWFDASVRPSLPAGAPEPTVTELHNALGR